MWPRNMAWLVAVLLTAPALAQDFIMRYRPNISHLSDYTPDSDEENCTCLSWTEAYSGKWVYNESVNESDPTFETKRFYEDENDVNGTEFNGTHIHYADCGQGHELSPYYHDLAHNQEPIWKPKLEYCDHLFKKFGSLDGDFNDCVKIARDTVSDEWYGGSWCYVRKSCSLGVDLNDTHPPSKAKYSSSGRIKRCREGEDSFLGDRTPGELYNMSQKIDADMATLVKMAYPVVRNQLVDFAGGLAEVQDVCTDGRPTVLDSVSSQPPFVLQHGFSQYHILDNLDHMVVGRALTYSTFKCANTSWQPCLDSVVVDEEIQKGLRK